MVIVLCLSLQVFVKGWTMKTVFQLRLDVDEKALWEHSAQEVGMSLAEWIRGICNTKTEPTPEIIEDEIIPEAPPKVKRGSLCPRCMRLGVPACSACIKANAESVAE